MKNRFIACIAIVSIVISMCGCHSHQFNEATCTQPMTCVDCGEIQGELLPHTFAEATCTVPKTCTVCGMTEGELLPHTFAEATCTVPKTCTVCGTTEGELLQHTFVEATCGVPKTCTVCGTTEGEPTNEHTTVLGKCGNCGQVQNNEVLLSVIRYIERANEENLSADEFIGEIDKWTVDSESLSYLQLAWWSLIDSRYEIHRAEQLLAKTDERITEMEIYKKISKVAHMELTEPEYSYESFEECLEDIIAYTEAYNDMLLEVYAVR